jgi:exopolyphosphatase / guanosine-5'-triphosphate,3'-diphosphate pyrophosphatase
VRVGVVDIGTNSTRLLIADVGADGPPEEVERRSVVTRLGEGVDAGGRLGDEPQRRVFEVLGQYAEAIEAHGAERAVAVMTSAVRDAANGAAFARAVGQHFGLDARTISGDEEARLTYLGATVARADPEPLLVIDIGGGSTELVIGVHGEVRFHVSTQIGVVRHSERHLTSDPPDPAELGALAGAVEKELEEAVPAREREHVTAAVAVAGTATQSAGIDLGAEGLDVEGHRLTVERLRAILERLAAVPLAERREIPGLDPDRAPTIVAGVVVLTRALAAFGLDEVEVSERDILWGAALETGRSTASN